MIMDRHDLTKGNILKQLITVSLPVMATSLMQMAYNLTDLFWLGRATPNEEINTGFIASAGIGGLFIWLSAAIMILVRIGTEVGVSQSVGRKDEESARIFARTGVQLEFLFALVFTTVLFSFTPFWVSLFNIPEQVVHDNAILYIRIISIGLMFNLLIPVFSATIIGTGNTIVPFIISGIGLVLNMILDPILIITFKLGIEGAAIATVIAQITVFIIFLIYFNSTNSLLNKAKFFKKIDKEKAKFILKLGLPAAIQSALFTSISMYISSMVAPFGKSANAVQKIGSQIESLSWLTAGGFQTALSAFVGQNFGARKLNRVLSGVRYALTTMVIYGIIVTITLYVIPGPIFQIFSNDKNTLVKGIDYLQILAVSQVFMIVESLVGGALNGLGKTIPQSIVSLTFNFLRIPMAYLLIPHYGLNGIWLSITISSIFKGIVIYIWYKLYIRYSHTFKDIDLSKPLSDDKIMV